MHNFFYMGLMCTFAASIIGCTERHLSVQELSSAIAQVPPLPLSLEMSSDPQLIGDLYFNVAVPESVSIARMNQLPWKVSFGSFVSQTCNVSSRICVLQVRPHRQGVGVRGTVGISLSPVSLPDAQGVSVVRVEKSLQEFEYNNAEPAILHGQLNEMKAHTNIRQVPYTITANHVDRVKFYFNDSCTGSSQELALAGQVELINQDGIQNIYIQGKDSFGNATDCYHLGAVSLDRLKPTVLIPTMTPAMGTIATHFSTFLNFNEDVEVDLDKIHLGEASAGCKLIISMINTKKYQVKVSECSETGSIRLFLQEGASKDLAGNLSLETELSFWVDNLGPLAPPNLSLGMVPDSLTQTPAILYSAPTDQGPAGVEGYQVQIEHLSGTILSPWALHSGGAAINGLPLQLHQSYRVRVRALDKVGNLGEISEVVWQPFKSDPCLGTPTIGTKCLEGAVYAGAATVATENIRYMTTPSGCGEIPTDKRGGGSVAEEYWANDDFSPTCHGGADFVTKYWNNGLFLNYAVPGVFSAPSTSSQDWEGVQNTDALFAVTEEISGGRYMAASYCAMLNYGGFSDWYLPSISELALIVSNLSSVSGSNLNGRYWSSTQSTDGNNAISYQSGSVDIIQKHNNYLVRCIRKY